jgi:hypothetical protein
MALPGFGVDEVRFPLPEARQSFVEEEFRRYYGRNAGRSEPLAAGLIGVAALPNEVKDLGRVVSDAERALVGNPGPGSTEEIRKETQFQVVQAIGKRNERSPAAMRLLTALVREGATSEIRGWAARFVRKAITTGEGGAYVDRTALLPKNPGFGDVALAAYASGVIPYDVVLAFVLKEGNPAKKRDLSAEEVGKITRFAVGIRAPKARKATARYILRRLQADPRSTEEATELVRLLITLKQPEAAETIAKYQTFVSQPTNPTGVTPFTAPKNPAESNKGMSRLVRVAQKNEKPTSARAVDPKKEKTAKRPAKGVKKRGR